MTDDEHLATLAAYFRAKGDTDIADLLERVRAELASLRARLVRALGEVDDARD